MTELDLLLRSLASPTRLRILSLLMALPAESRRAESCPSSLAAALRIARSSASHHLKVLLHMRLVRYWKVGRNKFYMLARGTRGSLQTRLLERLRDEMPDKLGPVPAHPSAKSGRNKTRPAHHSGADEGRLSPIWRGLTAYANFRRLRLLGCLKKAGVASSGRLMKTMDLRHNTDRYHVDKLIRRGMVERTDDGVRLCAKPPNAWAGFLTDLLSRELVRRAIKVE